MAKLKHLTQDLKHGIHWFRFHSFPVPRSHWSYKISK